VSMLHVLKQSSSECLPPLTGESLLRCTLAGASAAWRTLLVMNEIAVFEPNRKVRRWLAVLLLDSCAGSRIGRVASQPKSLLD
jgi:hypothetical protein